MAPSHETAAPMPPRSAETAGKVESWRMHAVVLVRPSAAARREQAAAAAAVDTDALVREQLASLLAVSGRVHAIATARAAA
jgi:hypothetical protein